MSIRGPLVAACAVVFGALLAPALTAPAHADELEFSFSGHIQTDLRFRIEERSIGDWYSRQVLPIGLSRQENTLRLRLEAEYGFFRGVGEVDLVLYGKTDDPEGFESLSQRNILDPFRIEAHALYLEAMDLFEGFDIRIGQQVVNWGVADQFNPTNVLNSDDLEDPLQFGEQQANLMIKLDYTVGDDWTFSGVLVPLFRPALLPRSASLGLAAIDRLPFLDSETRAYIQAQNAEATEKGYPAIVTKATPNLPEITADNMQFAFRVAGSILEQDIALMYYYGRNDFPVAALNYNTLVDEPLCKFAPRPPHGGYGAETTDPSQYGVIDLDADGVADRPECVDGHIANEVVLEFPRFQMIGLNLAGELPGVGIGYRFELGVFFPEERRTKIVEDGTLGKIHPLAQGSDYIEYDYDDDGVPGGPRPMVVADTPFAKWTLSLDYTIAEVVYVNAMWVHGLVDEFGAGDWISPGFATRSGGAVATETSSLTVCAAGLEAGAECAFEILRPRLGDYFVLGADFRFNSGQGIFRLFTIWDMAGYTERRWNADTAAQVDTYHSFFSAEGFSAVIYPELRYNFGGGLEMHAGALIQLGKTYTKFGDPAAGGTEVYMRARYSF